jgi:aspartokinase
LLSEENEEALLETFTHTANCEDLTFISQVGKIMVYGPHFGEVPGILGVTFSALSRSRVTPLAISASSSSLSWLFSPQQFKPALEVIYNLFEFPKNYSL